MGNLFRSFGNVPIVGQEKRPTREEMAADLMAETCERYKALRAEALAAEQACDPSKPWSPQAQECMDTIEALMQGPHRWVCMPVLLEHFPELVRPATEDEKAAAEKIATEQIAASTALLERASADLGPEGPDL